MTSIRGIEKTPWFAAIHEREWSRPVKARKSTARVMAPERRSRSRFLHASTEGGIAATAIRFQSK